MLSIPFAILEAQYDVSQTLLFGFGQPRYILRYVPFTNLLHIVWLFVFVYEIKLGILGVAISQTITAVLNMVSL